MQQPTGDLWPGFEGSSKKVRRVLQKENNVLQLVEFVLQVRIARYKAAGAFDQAAGLCDGAEAVIDDDVDHASPRITLKAKVQGSTPTGNTEI
ncbi:hypothetical protein [Rhizobium sp. GCM10022189]|uniref:hypothetical protein n=1 Tax=Rhizobium sp. GCM10022189 TaxID=3252654 RepID=UPI003616DD88